jgi:hypothetical protein
MSFTDYGITIIDAHSPVGYQYATFEIRTNALGGFERYQWQSGGSNAKLWHVVGYDSKALLAQGDDVPASMTKLLQRVHAMEPCKLTYREFQILVDGWVAGRTHK